MREIIRRNALEKLGVRCVAACLAGTMIGGCATRPVFLTSEPDGAVVTVAGSTCITPCQLQVPVGVNNATFHLPTGESKEVPLPNTTTSGARAGYHISAASGKTLKLVSYPFLAVGIAGVALFTNDETDAVHDRNLEMSKDEALIIAGSLVIGGLLYFAGMTLEEQSESMVAQVHAVFTKPAENPAFGTTNTVELRPALQLDEITTTADKLLFPGDVRELEPVTPPGQP